MTSQSAGDSTTGWTQALLPPPPLPPPLTPPRHRKRTVFREPDLENIEDVYMYKPGGHHPVDLQDVIQHRFKIIHKLGNGGFAIVWLARDLDQGQYVALKILRAKASDREIRVLQHLKDITGNARITNLRETFAIHGPNGVHQCLVLDFGGPSLKQLTLRYERPPFRFLTAAARKLVEGLTALHAAGVCHGDIQNWTEEEIYHRLGRPKIAPLLLLDGKPAPAFAPTHIIDALDYSQLKEEHLSTNVLITDFGEAFFRDNVPKALGTQVSFSAPELLFGYQPSCAVDLWALGCLIFEIYTFRLLIPTAFGSNEEALAFAIETIGALPEAWQPLSYNKNNPLEDGKLGKKHRFFDDQIQRTRVLDSQLQNLLPEMPQDQRATFLQLLNSILIFEPSHRLPAAEVAKHIWFGDKPEHGEADVTMF